MKARSYREFLDVQERFAAAALTGLLAASGESPVLDEQLLVCTAWRLAYVMALQSPTSYATAPEMEMVS